MAELERELRALAPDWPPTPDLAAGVLGRLGAESARPSRRRRPRRAALALLLLLGGAFAIPPARAAILDVLGIGGARIERREPTATPRPAAPGAPLGAGLDLGDAVTAAEARDRAGFAPGPPRALGRPDAVFFAAGPPDGGRVSYVYRARRGLPRAAETGAGLLVSVMLAQVSPFLEKAAGPGTRVERFRARGDLVVRLSGAPHGVAYAGPGQQPIFEDQRLAGATLLLERRDGLLIRVEGRISRARALAIARSLSSAP